MNIFFVLLFLSLFHEKVEGDAAQIETVDSKPGDPLSIPLISDGGAPLVAMLDTSSMNVRIKSFIKTLMGKMIDESLTKDSTTDIIRNITKLELNEELVNVVMTHVSFRQEIQNIVKETLKQNSTIDLIRNIAVQELNGQLRQRNQSEDKVVSDSDQDIEVDKISKPISATDTTGNEFYLGFLTSLDQRGKIYLYIVSTTDGSCQIFIPSLSILNTSFAISNTSINSYDISPSVFMSQNGIQRKVIHVRCNIPVSIYGLTFTGYEVDGFLALPSKSLGNKYIVSSFTPWKSSEPSSNSNFGIIGIDQSTNVTINFRITGGSVTYNNIKYGNNDTLSIHLTQFDTFYLSSHYDLSGTLVTASSPVAVMSGVRTSYLRNGYGNHMEEMILPNEQLGRDFIVPKLYDSQCNFRIFAQEYSQIRIYNNSVIQYADIQRGRFQEFENYDTLYTLQSSAPAQVQLYCNGVSTRFDAFMVTLPSIQHFKSSYKYPIVNDFKYTSTTHHFYVTVIVQSNARKGLRLDDKHIVKYEMISNITLESTLYSVITVEQSVGLHEIKQQHEIPFGLIVYGRNQYSGYGFPAGFATKIKP